MDDTRGLGRLHDRGCRALAIAPRRWGRAGRCYQRPYRGVDFVYVVKPFGERNTSDADPARFIHRDDQPVAIDVAEISRIGQPSTGQTFGHEHQVIVEPFGDISNQVSSVGGKRIGLGAGEVSWAKPLLSTLGIDPANSGRFEPKP